MQHRIEALLGPNSTMLWSVYHDRDRNEQQTREALGVPPPRVCRKRDLPTSRIVILTTAKLKQEAMDGEDTGCLRYRGDKRSIVFIDEFPEMVDTYQTTPTQVQELFDRLIAQNSQHPWLPVLEKAIGCMMPIMRTNGQRYLPVTVLDAGDIRVFGGDVDSQVNRLSDATLSDEERRNQEKPWRETIKFLKAAVRRQGFYSRRDHRFYGYERYLDTSYPGYIVLDATADIHGVLALDPGVKIHPGKRLHYDQLEPYVILHPPEFKDVHDLQDADIRRYGYWIQATVIRNTQPGDEVLVVAHKKVLKMELFAGSNDPAAPLDWDGRKINTQHWGAGIGTNRYARKTCVFLFGDYYPPRPETIAHVHGWSGAPLTESGLRTAQGVKQKDGRYVPGGD